MQRSSRWLVPMGLLLLFAAGLAVRRCVLNAQFSVHGANLPFTLESALNFRRVQQVCQTGSLPEVDRDLQYPDGVVVRKTDTVGAEYLYAAVARLFPRFVPLAARVRWTEAAWFCLGIPLMALWVGWRTGSRWGGFVAGAFYAVALSSVIRSTGQEISHENFALPLLIGHLAFDALAGRTADARRRGAAILLSGLLLALAVATWDLVQFYVILWALASWARLARGRLAPREVEGATWIAQWASLLLVGLLNPYLRAHGFVRSPAMMASHGMAMALVLSPRLPGRSRLAASLGLPAGLALLAVLLPGSYGSSYGHFASLLAAKIRFLNRKPADPALLTFDQRIMWVPALHSATWPLTRSLFPAMVGLSLIGALTLWRRAGDRSDSRRFQLLFFFTASLAAFALFVRFHVYVAVFAAGVLGMAAARAARKGWTWRWAVGGVLMAGMAVEAAHTLRAPERWGRTQVYYRELGELTGWLGRYAEPEPVAANFGVSASVLAYGGCPVLLHPKFESPEIRARVRSYGEALFRGTELDFWAWAAKRGAGYYVHAMGEFSTIAPEQQMRYFADALQAPAGCAARVFEFAPESAGRFRLLWGNRKYRVFKVLGPDDENVAARFAERAEKALQAGDLDGAEDKAVAALLVRRDHAKAQDVLRHVGSLRDQGFRSRDE